MTERAAAAACTHCGLPLAPTRRTEQDAERYCCSGCFLAHRLSHRGLEGRTDRLVSRVVLSAFLAMGVMVFSLSLYGGLLHDDHDSEGSKALTGIFRLGAMFFSTPALVLLGVPLADAVVRMRRWLSAESLILAGSLSAWTVSVWNTFRGGGEVYFDTATMVLVLYSVGRWLDVRARERATEELRRILPEREAPVARLTEGEQAESSVSASELRVGDLVRVRPGEIVPVDGIILSGRSFADTSALTGESRPQSSGAGDRIHAGVTLLDGSVVLRAEATVGHRLRDEIERLLAQALARRSRWVEVADRIAGALMPAVVVLAVATIALRWRSVGAEDALLDGLSIVLISCPCALGIATPLAFWTAIGAAWKRGVLVRGGEALEALARVRTVLFDKTGTLTSGEFEVTSVRALADSDEDDVLRLAAALETGSEHLIARSIRRTWSERQLARELPPVEDFRALPGIGVVGRIDGHEYELARASENATRDGATRVELRRDGQVVGEIALTSRARAESAMVVRELARRRIEMAVLTGDAEGPAETLARELGLRVEARLSPADKVERVRRAGRGAAFVGDGLNDAAALASADVGISMAGGAATSLSAAQVNLLRPGLTSLPEVLGLARAAVLAAKINLAWAFLYNAFGLYLAVTGRLTPIFAASAMVASSLVSVFNSRRLVRQESSSATSAEQLRTTTERSSELEPTVPVRTSA